MTMADAPPFRRIALLGLGLIGSSVARAVRLHGLAGEIVGHAKSGATRERAMALGFLDRVEADPAEAIRGADLVMICTPLGAYAELARAMLRSEEHTSELQSLMRISYAVFCLKKKNK